MRAAGRQALGLGIFSAFSGGGLGGLWGRLADALEAKAVPYGKAALAGASGVLGAEPLPKDLTDGRRRKSKSPNRREEGGLGFVEDEGLGFVEIPEARGEIEFVNVSFSYQVRTTVLLIPPRSSTTYRYLWYGS